MWNIINNTSIDHSNIELKGNGKILNLNECAETFNNFIISGPKDIISILSLASDHQFIDSNFKDLTNKNSLFLRPLTEEDVLELIHKLKKSNSSGTDEISNLLLKQVGVYIVTPLTHIINLSLEQGIYPERLKVILLLLLYFR